MLDLTGLDALRTSGLLEDTPVRRVLELPLAHIEADPSQPRRHFSEQALNELADTIRSHGVLQPISVHRHPSIADRYRINVGERRVRASRLAGLVTIPATIDAPMDPYGRVIENLAREALSPFELAQFVAQRTAAGESRRAIAQRLGKPASFITEVAALADAPEAVQSLYARGLCSDVRVLYTLIRLHRSDPNAVAELCTRSVPITRIEVEKQLSNPSRHTIESETEHCTERAPHARRANAFLVQYEGRVAYLPLTTPPSMSVAQVVFEDGSRQTVELCRLRLIQWTRLL